MSTHIPVGYSNRINDPVFGRYIARRNRISTVFGFLLPPLAVCVAYIAGEMGIENIKNPDALYIGLIIGAFFLIFALITIIKSKNAKSWDGIVTDKKTKTEVSNVDNEQNIGAQRTVYVIYFRDNKGKLHQLSGAQTQPLYDYFHKGEKVRYHANLGYYEKYDKSGDSIIFCALCGKKYEITEDNCTRCKCPLLK